MDPVVACNDLSSSISNHEGDEIATNEPKFRLVKLSGAAKKRFKWLLNQGHDRSEALRLAQEKMPQTEHSSSPLVERMIETSLKKSFKLGIVHKNFPDVLLTTEESQKIKNSIIDLMLEEKLSISPKFLDLKIKHGWIFVACEDESTTDWLKSCSDKIGNDSKILENDDIPGQEILVCTFPDSVDYSTSKIFNIIKVQNVNLSVDKWKVLSQCQEGKNMVLIISMNYLCYKELQSVNMMFSYLFCKVKIYKKTLGKLEEKTTLYSSIVKNNAPKLKTPSKQIQTTRSKNKILSEDGEYSRKRSKNLLKGKGYTCQEWKNYLKNKN